MDIEPEETPVARREPQWRDRDTDLPTPWNFWSKIYPVYKKCKYSMGDEAETKGMTPQLNLGPIPWASTNV